MTEVLEAPAAAAERLRALRRIAIVPAFNEEERDRGASIGRAARVRPRASTSSSSTTARPTARPRSARACGANVISLPFNLGIGGAVQTGFRYAWEQGFDVAVRVDGDGQHDPAELDAILRPVLADEADVAVGSRFIGGDGYRSSRSRRVGIRLLAWIVSALDAPAHHRSDVGLPGREPAGHRLFAADYPHDYPEAEATVMVFKHRLRLQRGAGQDARARERPLVDHGRPLGLLHGQGRARDLRRALPAQGGATRVTPLARLDRRGDCVRCSCCSSSSS